MSLTDLIRKYAKPAAFSLALATSSYSCGGTEESDEPVVTEECRDYKCESTGRKQYDCKQACENLTGVCKPDRSFNQCVSDCLGAYENPHWPQEVIDCWATSCDGFYCH